MEELPGDDPGTVMSSRDGERKLRLVPLHSVQRTARRSLSKRLEAFILDRFSTKLEDPRTGRKLMPWLSGNNR
jgi:hypothetical protein